MRLKNNLTLLALSLGLAAAAAIPEGYYTQLDGKKKAELKAAAKAAAINHEAVPYGEDTWDAFKITDTRMMGGNLCWWDMYAPINVKVSNGHPGMNIEHSVPNSWWGGVKNDAYKDLFHLNPSDAAANGRKSNHPLGIIENETWSNGLTNIGRPAAGTCGGATTVFEPADEYKGDFARAYFYVFTIYDDISWAVTQPDRNYMFDGTDYPSLRPWAYEMLLEWAKEDPVDDKEISRNEDIYGIQNNRNPFIDFPDLAEYIWGDKSETEFYAADQTPNPEPGSNPWVDPNPGGDPDESIEGIWRQVSLPDQIAENKDYIIVSVKDHAAMSWTMISNKALDKAEDMLSVSEEGVIGRIGKDVAIVNLVPSGDEWLIKVLDNDGESQGYLSSASSKNMRLNSNGTPVTITPEAEYTSIDFGAEIGTLQYNASSPRFCTYTTNQQKVFLYYRDDESGVEEIQPAVETEMWYDLTGRPVDPAQARPGIYIHAGKKILIRK